MLKPALTCQMALLLHKVTDRFGTWLASILNADILIYLVGSWLVEKLAI
jgi:hypothetical protein